MIKSYPKQKPFRSKKAIEWFRTEYCICCEPFQKDQVTGHHEPLKGHGTSSKGPDNEQVPLCFNHHRERHDIGRESFYKKYGLDWRHTVKLFKYSVNKYLEMNNNWRKK